MSSFRLRNCDNGELRDSVDDDRIVVALKEMTPPFLGIPDFNIVVRAGWFVHV